MNQLNIRGFCCEVPAKYINLSFETNKPRLCCEIHFHNYIGITVDQGGTFLPIDILTRSYNSAFLNPNYRNKNIYLNRTLVYLDQIIAEGKLPNCLEQTQLRSNIEQQITLNQQEWESFQQEQLSSFIYKFIVECQRLAKIYSFHTDGFRYHILKILRKQDEDYNNKYLNLQHQFQAKLDKITSKNAYWLQFISNAILLSNLCLNDFYNSLEEKLGRKIIRSTQLYKLDIDGRDAQIVWDRIENRGDTLFLMKLDTNQVIGAYVQIAWSFQSDWTYDPSFNSFLFSVTKEEIYPVKFDHPTIYCSRSFLPSFGHDLYLTENFEVASETFGLCYDISNYENIDIKTHLTDAKFAQIVDFEIYQLKFDQLSK